MAQLTPEQMAILAKIAGQTNASISAHNQSIDEGRAMAIERITPEQLRASMRQDPLPMRRVPVQPPPPQHQRQPVRPQPPPPPPAEDDIASIMPDVNAPLIPMPEMPVVPSMEDPVALPPNKPQVDVDNALILQLVESIATSVRDVSRNVVLMLEIMREMRPDLIDMMEKRGPLEEVPFDPDGGGESPTGSAGGSVPEDANV